MVSVHDTGPAAAGHASVTTAEDEAATAEAEPEVDFATLLAAADPAAGEKVFGKCKACHTVEEGGANKVGPNLWDVVGGPVASKDFAYSGALSELDGTWDYAALNAFLEDPKGYAAGTKMTFAGLKQAQQRAEVIAYLRAYGESPPPLPEPTAAAPAEEPASAAPTEQSTQVAAATPAEPAAATDASVAADAGLGAMLAAADAAEGEKVFRKCKACHDVEQGGKHKVGPNLWNVVGRAIGGAEGFNYSGALAERGGDWSYEQLDAYLEDPKGFAPGNKMSFAGLRKPDDRADVILYLRKHTESPPPLP